MRIDNIEELPPHLQIIARQKLAEQDKKRAGVFVVVNGCLPDGKLPQRSPRHVGSPEADWQKEEIRQLHTYGWFVLEIGKARVMRDGKDVYRTPVRADGKGFPDIVAVRPPRVILIENKSENGKAEPEQVEWLMLLAKCPQLEVKVLRPHDLETLLEWIK